MKNLLSLLSTRQTNILSGASILMVTMFASRFLGLIRYRLLVHFFNTNDAGIFIGASKVPDALFNLLIFGILSVALIPIFIEHMHKNGEDDAFKFASNILNLSLVAFGFIILLAFIFVSPLNSLVISGFSGAQKEMADRLTQILLFSQLFLVIGTFFVGITNAYQRFLVSSLAGIFYNIGSIFGIIFFSQNLGLMGPVLGVLLGAILHVLVQLPAIKSIGFRYTLSLDFLNSGVKEVFQLMSMRNISLVVEQISELVSTTLASLISIKMVTLLTFAQVLFYAPVSLFGATIAQAAFPILSKEQAKGEKDSFKITLLTTLHQILFLTLPAAAILIVLRIPVVRLIYGATNFNWTDTVLTGMTVALMALALPAQSVILLLVRAFYAVKDTKTPVIVSIITVVVNILLASSFIQLFHLPVWSLGLAYAIATNLSLVLLIYYLNKKVSNLYSKSLLMPALKMLVSAITAALALYIPIKALDQVVVDTTKTGNLIFLTSIASTFGMSIYLLLVWLMDVKELETFTNLFKKFASLQAKVRSEEIVEENP